MKVIKIVRFSLKMLRCRARELSYSTACASRPFFIKMRMRIALYKRVQIYIQGPEKLRGDSLETTAFGRYGVKTSEKANMYSLTAVLLQRPLAEASKGFKKW